jgi:uncharacterized membrane protein YkvA (DUF1232 family)
MKEKRVVLRNPNKGFFQNLVLRFKLILRLMGDKRVNFLLKFLPAVGLIYLISPIDLFPDISLPIIAYADDAFVIWLCLTLFLALCPEEVVKEHMQALQKVVTGTWREASEQEQAGEVIEAESHDVRDDEQ